MLVDMELTQKGCIPLNQKEIYSTYIMYSLTSASDGAVLTGTRCRYSRLDMRLRA